MTHQASYCIDDNKLRLYPDWDDPEFDKEEAKALGFRWASKQELYVCPSWSPQAEDYLLDLCGEIDAEELSPEERAADRAERFGMYRDKRRADAGGLADRYEDGGQVFGNQSQAKADRAARRADRLRLGSVSMWEKAEYWQQRTAGVIRNALYRAKPAVRRSRIKRLEAEQRKHEKSVSESLRRWEAWEKIATMDGADVLLPLNESGYAIAGEMNGAQKVAYVVACDGRDLVHLFHPTSEAANEKAREIHGQYCRGFSAYDFLTDDEFIGLPFERFTPKQYADLYLSKVGKPGREGSYSARWSAHYENRLTFERAMLANEGGAVSDVEIEPGGWFGDHQVHKVNKSSATGKVTSVMVRGQWGYVDVSGRSVYLDHANPDGLAKMDVTRLPESAYRAPTDEEKAAFAAVKSSKKAASGAPKLLNPTNADAERLQAIWNQAAQDKHPDAPLSSVKYITQKTYSYQSKSDVVGTHGIGSAGNQYRFAHNEKAGDVVCKLRCHTYYMSRAAACVIVLTDKPQKPLPLDWAAIEYPAVEASPVEVKPVEINAERMAQIEAKGERLDRAIANGAYGAKRQPSLF